MRGSRAAAACLSLAACRGDRAPPPRRSSLPAPASPRAAVARSATSVRALAVPGFGDAVVVTPDGDGPHAVLLAAHANYDRPEYQCDLWRSFVRGRAFVLCPRGAPQPLLSRRDEPRFTWPLPAAMNREFDAALAALRAAYGARVSPGPVVYAGFSLGAVFAGSYVSATRERVSAAVLVEGGHTYWSDRAAQAFAAQGGRAVVFACGQSWCAQDAGAAARRLRAVGVASEVTVAPGAGHAFGGPVAEALRPAFEGLVVPLLRAVIRSPP